MAEKTVKKVTRYTKQQLMGADVFAHQTDALDVVLQDGKKYTIKEAQDALRKFMKGAI